MRGCIRKRGGSWEWRARTPDGRHVSKAGFETRKAAQDALNRALAEMADDRFVRPDNLTVEPYLEQWLATIEGTVARTTYINYKNHIERHLVPNLGDIPLQKLNEIDLATLYKKLSTCGHYQSTPKKPKGLSPKSIRHIATTLHHALADAVDSRLVIRNVADSKRAKPPQLSREVHQRAWTPQQLQLFLGMVRDDRLYPLWRFIAMTGVRRGEALGLRWSDVDLAASVCSVVQARTGFGVTTPKTPRSRRALDLDPETVRVLRAWHSRQSEERLRWGEHWHNTGFVFTREDGIGYHPDGITGMFDHLQDKLNKKIVTEAKKRNVEPELLPHIRLHDLRHTHATLLLVNGEHPKVVSERLGHASVAFTLSTYAHVLPGLQREAVGRLAALVDG